MERLVGEGWSLGVFRDGDQLQIALPVDSSFISTSFEFSCSDEDYRVLAEDDFRRHVLDFILHEWLQPTMLRDGPKRDEAKMLAVIKTVLHGSLEDVETEIDSCPQPSRARYRLETMRGNIA
ncbi:hypothetical protein [Agrobacterium sp.]|jgi:hypothetical protein|uniref:hypothetical protein n=1 Tax=Agrobacterium sp. TaxID=361 RepID=UPI0028AA5998